MIRPPNAIEDLEQLPLRQERSGNLEEVTVTGVDPQSWLADVVARINDHMISNLAALLPWHWAAEMKRRKLAA